MLALCTIAFAAPAVMAAPVVDGNLADFITFGQQLEANNSGFGVAITDKPDAGGNPTVETIYSDSKFIPCPTVGGLPPAIGTHWVNGTEIFYHNLDYVPGSTQLYLGLRTEGFVGDSDGDNDPNGSGSAAANCNPNDNIEDPTGISLNETYAWRFDLDCDGTIDASIEIVDNQVVGKGLFAGVTGSFAFAANAGTGASGHDLEVVVNLTSPLPAAFKYARVESNAFDGLSEDRSDGIVLIGTPEIAVQKSAEPAVICPNGITRFTINVQNTGTTPLSVVAVDVLPAALSYNANVSSTCGGAVSPNGQTITFGPFDLAAGGSCSISFDAKASADCFGQVTNVVDVTGTFNSLCIKGGGLAATAHAEASVTCKAPPCVSAAAECNPAAACPGAAITVKGSATNCGSEAEDITIDIEGQQQSFSGVAAGATVNWTRNLVMPACTNGQQVPFNVTATASNECGQATPSNASCNIQCVTPEVEIDKSVSPSGPVDQGTTLTYTIVVTNPSKTVPLENVHVSDELCSEVTYQGNANPTPTTAPAVGSNGTLTWDLGTIAANSSVTITFDVLVNTLESPACEAGGRSCTNTAVVTGDCAGGSGVRAEDSVTTDINPCLAEGTCRLTGGGCMNDDPDTGRKGHKQSTFGGNSSPLHEGGGPTGNSWEHVYRDGREILFNWHSWDAHVIACSVVPPGPCSPKAINTRADFVGTGLYSIGAGGREEEGNMVAYIIDHKEGNCNKDTRDEYSIIVRTGTEIGFGDIVFQATGFIDCGNLQIHETPKRLFGQAAGTTLPGNEAGSMGVALLNRAYPNPFSASTSFAYKVAEGGRSVEVGVFNVAGRLVKTLASGSQAAGTYTVTWDGSDDSGVRMAPGVYFLKSKVGGEQNVSRLIYVAR